LSWVMRNFEIILLWKTLSSIMSMGIRQALGASFLISSLKEMSQGSMGILNRPV
jgi:hypothetical protein